MASWSEIITLMPDFAARIQAVMDEHKHKTMATLRKDGSPRISGTEADFRDGKVAHSPELRHRMRSYEGWQPPDWGGIVLQENVEDNRLATIEYGIRELGVEMVELKWGQGAKNIGGEVKVQHLAKAQRLKQRGYIVLPDPQDPNVIEAYERGAIREFERHSRIGMVTEEGFRQRVNQKNRCQTHTHDQQAKIDFPLLRAKHYTVLPVQ